MLICEEVVYCKLFIQDWRIYSELAYLFRISVFIQISVFIAEITTIVYTKVVSLTFLCKRIFSSQAVRNVWVRCGFLFFQPI